VLQIDTVLNKQKNDMSQRKKQQNEILS